jgi:dihydrofolate synthase / folylpolyglutamate synthase
LASVITNIELDHEKWLGLTHEQIAGEKAGIIKPGVPVITGAQPGRGLEVIAETARKHGCPLTVVDSPAAARPQTARPLAPALIGRHQLHNAAVAQAVVEVLSANWPVPEKAKQSGLQSVSWPGRMQLIQNGPNQRILLDGAHNSASALALRDAFQEAFPAIRPTVILGVLADKDWSSMVRTLVPLASRMVTVPVSSPRTVEPSPLAAACREAAPETPVDAQATLAAALAACARDEFILITGSLYLVGEALEALHALPVLHQAERGLNDWSGGKTPDAACKP